MKTLLTLTLISAFICNACGVKEDPETTSVESGKTAEIKVPEKSFLEIHNAPLEQTEFLNKFHNLPMIQISDIGTREAEPLELNGELLAKSLKQVTEWICEVELSTKIDGNYYETSCFIDNNKKILAPRIYFEGLKKYYKGDLVRVSGDVTVSLQITGIKLLDIRARVGNVEPTAELISTEM